MQWVDMHSDTVTQPTPAMRQAMRLAAEVARHHDVPAHLDGARVFSTSIGAAGGGRRVSGRTSLPRGS